MNAKVNVVPEGLEKIKNYDRIAAMAAAIKKEFKIGEGGSIEVPKDVYEKHLPENITMDTIKQLQSHQNDFVTATGLALGNTGLEYFKKPKSADSLSVELAAGKDKLALTLQRSTTVPDGAGGTKVKYGQLSARWRVNAAGNRGSFEVVRKHISSQVTALLSS